VYIMVQLYALVVSLPEQLRRWMEVRLETERRFRFSGDDVNPSSPLCGGTLFPRPNPSLY
jgi:hypothetical protein